MTSPNSHHSGSQDIISEDTGRRVPVWRVVLGYQPLIWSVLTLLYFAFDSGRQEEVEGIAYLGLLVRSLCWGITGALVTTLLHVLYTRFDELVRASRGAAMAIGVLAASLSFLIAFHHLDGVLVIEEGWVPITSWPQAQFVAEWFDYALFMLAWHGIVLTLTRQEQLHRERERVLQIQRLAEESRIAMLRYQLDPHFLFNSLNSAIALVDEDPRGTQQMLTRLAHLLRERLEAPLDEATSLGEELEMIRHYIAIEKLRFEDKLQVIEDVDPRALPRALPPFILQPLVENAIHHGMRTSHPPLTIRIEVRIDDHDALILSLWNSGTWQENQGIGLSNVRARLSAELPNYTFMIGAAAREGVLATLEIPGEQHVSS